MLKCPECGSTEFTLSIDYAIDRHYKDGKQVSQFWNSCGERVFLCNKCGFSEAGYDGGRSITERRIKELRENKEN